MEKLLERLLRRFCPGCAEGVNDDQHTNPVGAAYLASQIAPYVIGEMDRARAEGLEWGARAERERCAQVVLDWASNYPATVFPADSDSRDAVSGTALREVLPRVAERLRDGL